MREKYVDERWPYTISYEQEDGQVLVQTVDDRFSVKLPQPDAEKLMKAYDKMQAALVRCALAFSEAAPEQFTDFWYGAVELEESRK